MSDNGSAPSQPPVFPPADRADHRERLPTDRESLTHKFSVGGTEGYFTVGFYPDGRIGELFVVLALDSTTTGALLDQWAAAVSIAIQFGAPIRSIVSKFAYQNFEPQGITRSPHHRMVSSIVDYVSRTLWLIHNNGPEKFRTWKQGDPALAFPEF